LASGHGAGRMPAGHRAMRILALDLIAFGPFTGRHVDLSGGTPGLHVVYGPNEAGKSSALRALTCLLFGFPERSPDTYLHPGDKLRVGGRLWRADGSELRFVRRKGRRNTLLSVQGEPLAEDLLAPFLGGVGLELFRTLFGIDHETLVQGARDILRQKGEIGQALFSAGLGIANLRGVLQALEDEAGALYAPRGTTRTINSSVTEYRDAARRVKMLSLPGREWDDHRKALDRAESELERLENERDGLERARNRLVRLRRVLPLLARRRELTGRLASAGEVIVLAEDFGARRRAAQSKRDQGHEALARAAVRLEALQSEHAAITVRQEVLDRAEAIEALHQRLGEHRKARLDRPRLVGELDRIRDTVAEQLRDLRPDLAPDRLELLRPALSQRRRIQELGNRLQALEHDLAQAAHSARDRRRRLEAARAQRAALAPARDTGSLSRIVDTIRRAGDLDAEWLQAREAHAAHAEQCQADLEGLGLWEGTLEQLEGLPVPPVESIDRFEAAFRGGQERIQQSDQQCREIRQEREELDSRLQALQSSGDVPDEEDLEAARARRELGWRLVRQAWLEGKDVGDAATAYDTGDDLAAAYERSVRDADELADRLRREAERVHQKATFRARLRHLGGRLEALQAERSECGAAREALSDDWRGLWAACGIVPLTPREMRGWLERCQGLRLAIARVRELRSRLETVQATITRHREALIARLAALGEEGFPANGPFAALLDHGAAVVTAATAEARERLRLDSVIADLEGELEAAAEQERSAARALELWKSQWAEAVGCLGLPPAASPAEANDVLEDLAQLFVRHREAGQLQERIRGIDRDARAFAGEVRSIRTRLAPGEVELPPDQAVMNLNALLTRTRNDAARRDTLAQRIREAQEEIGDAEALLRAAAEQFAGLRAEAACREDAELEGAEARSVWVQAQTRELDVLDAQLVAEGEGASMAELEDDARDVDPDALPGRIEQLTRRIEESAPLQNELYTAKGREEAELRKMDGGAGAAQASEQAQALLARIGADAERYVRLRLAARILHREIERYREANQGPVMNRAGVLFSALTRRSFTGLSTEYDEKDEPVLVGVRPDAARVRVEGMSSGTRDQLYLALRLATLEKYLQEAEPLPFVVDDILINFDDARTAATLAILAELSVLTQVILFTHHARVVEAARQVKGTAGVLVHEFA
jgi:uncharacterized protein YhaN